MTTFPLRFLQCTQRTKPPFRELWKTPIFFTHVCSPLDWSSVCVTLYVEEQENCVKVWGPTSWSDPTSAPSPSLVEATARPGDQAEANNRNQITFKKFNQFKRFVWQRESGKFSLVLFYCIRKKVVFLLLLRPQEIYFFFIVSILYTVKWFILTWIYSTPWRVVSFSFFQNSCEAVKGAQVWDFRSLGFSWFLLHKAFLSCWLWG